MTTSTTSGLGCTARKFSLSLLTLSQLGCSRGLRSIGSIAAGRTRAAGEVAMAESPAGMGAASSFAETARWEGESSGRVSGRVSGRAWVATQAFKVGRSCILLSKGHTIDEADGEQASDEKRSDRHVCWVMFLVLLIEKE